jgi:hypothetical protein
VGRLFLAGPVTPAMLTACAVILHGTALTTGLIRPPAVRAARRRCGLGAATRGSPAPAAQIFGMRSVLLIIRLPDRANSSVKACSSHGPRVHVPP